MKDLQDRSIERTKRRGKIAEEEKARLEQEELIRKQIEVQKYFLNVKYLAKLLDTYWATGP